MCVCVSKEERGTVSGSFWRSSPQQSCDSIKIIRVAHPRVALTKGIYGVRTRVTLTPSLWGTNAITCFTDATTAQRGWGTYPRSWGWQVVKVGFKPRKSVSTVFIFLPTTSSSKSQLYPCTLFCPSKSSILNPSFVSKKHLLCLPKGPFILKWVSREERKFPQPRWPCAPPPVKVGDHSMLLSVCALLPIRQQISSK